MPKPVGSTPSQTVHQPLRWPSLAISSSTWRCEGSSTPYNSSIELRYAVRVGALPVSIRDSVDGARPRRSATSSSLIDCDSRSRLNSLPSRRRRTVGPTDISHSPPFQERSNPPEHEADRTALEALAWDRRYTNLPSLVRSH